MVNKALDVNDIKPENLIKLTDEDLNDRMIGYITRNEKELKQAIFTTFDNIKKSINPNDDTILRDLSNTEIPGKILQEIDENIQNFVLVELTDYWAFMHDKAIEDIAAAIKEKIARDYIPTSFDRYFQNWTQSRSGELITNFTNEQLYAFRDTVQYFNKSVELAINPRDMAVYLQRFTGLTERQSNSLLAMRDELLSQGYAETTIQKTIFYKATQMLQYRAERIARTELTTAYNQAGLSNIKQAVGDGLLAGEGRILKVWYAALDERVCDICGDLHEKAVELNDTFPDGYDAPSAHPNCRCTMLTYIQKEV